MSRVDRPDNDSQRLREVQRQLGVLQAQAAGGVPAVVQLAGASTGGGTAPGVGGSPSPSTSVTPAGAAGRPSNPGTATGSFSMGDHDHGTPAGGATATDAFIWRPVLDASGAVLVAVAGGEAVMGFSPA